MVLGFSTLHDRRQERGVCIYYLSYLEPKLAKTNFGSYICFIYPVLVSNVYIYMMVYIYISSGMPTNKMTSYTHREKRGKRGERRERAGRVCVYITLYPL